MARQGPTPDTLICPFCERIMPRTEFATDRWREARGKNPGRCWDCERELARAKSAFSPTQRFATADHTAAYYAAKDTCRNHAWGSAYYNKSVKAHYRELVAKMPGRGLGQGKDQIRTHTQRHADEAVLHERAERNRADRERALETAVKARTSRPALPASAPEDDPEKAARKAAIRARRARR